MANAAGITEADWQRTVSEGLEHFGYMVNHVRPMQTKQGQWKTGTSLKGWPDLTGIGTGARAGFVLYIECKGIRTPTTPEQFIVLDALAEGETNRAWLLRPMDGEGMTELVKWIARPETSPRRFGFAPEEVGRARSSTRSLNPTTGRRGPRR